MGSHGSGALFLRLRQISFVVLVIPLLSACGGGSSASGSSSSGSVANASPGGIWTGTESVSGLQVTGIVDEQGDAEFIRTDGVQYVGIVSTSGNSISGNIEGFMPFGSTWPDGSAHGTGTVSGSITERVSAQLNTRFTTDAGTTTTGTLNLAFNSLYNQSSSLATIAGNYTDSSTGTVVTIRSDGTVFAQDANTGCVVNGTVSVIDANYDAYRVQVTFANCSGQDAALNGVQLRGLATRDTTVSPARVIAGVSGTSGAGIKYAIVYVLNGS